MPATVTDTYTHTRARARSRSAHKGTHPRARAHTHKVYLPNESEAFGHASQRIAFTLHQHARAHELPAHRARLRQEGRSERRSRHLAAWQAAIVAKQRGGALLKSP
jgi:hypothetical protein